MLTIHFPQFEIKTVNKLHKSLIMQEVIIKTIRLKFILTVMIIVIIFNLKKKST